MIDRRQFALFASSLALITACQQGGGASKSAVEGDMALGPADAKVTVIEYASLACHVCETFHKEIWPQLKANYIDTGKIRFIFREFPTGEPTIARAEHMLARCMSSTPEQYFKAVDMFFDAQDAVFQAAQANQLREKLLELAKTGGMSEAQFTACISDETQSKRLQRVAEEANKAFKIDGTPTIIINGEVIENTAANPYTYERLAKLIDAKLAA
jgi:protein-disulfide isomerase